MDWTNMNIRQPISTGPYLCWVLRKDGSEQCAICHYSACHWSLLNLNNERVLFWMELPKQPSLADEQDNINSVLESC
jgi:hypothetical protein